MGTERTDQEEFVDLKVTYTYRLIWAGSFPEAARRIAAVVLPADLVEFTACGPFSLQAAHDALDYTLGQEAASEPPQIYYTPRVVTLLPPVPHPLLLRDFSSVGISLANGYPYSVVHLYQCLEHAARHKLTRNIDEFGVFKGGTTLLLAQFAEHLGLTSAHIYGFNTVGGFPPRRSVLSSA